MQIKKWKATTEEVGKGLVLLLHVLFNMLCSPWFYFLKLNRLRWYIPKHYCSELSAELIQSRKVASVCLYCCLIFWLTSCSLNLIHRWGVVHCQTRLSRYPAKSHWPHLPPCPPVLPVNANIQVHESATIILHPALLILCWHQILNLLTKISDHKHKINISGEQKQQNIHYTVIAMLC